MRWVLLAALASVLIAVGVLGRARSGAVAPAPAPEPPTVAAEGSEPEVDLDDLGAFVSDGDSSLGRPRSLRGTRTDGGLAVDASGRFMPTIDARRLFDYFLTASGEVTPETLRRRIVAEIERRLAPVAAAEATAVLDSYLAYRERVRLLATEETSADVDLEARLDTLVAIRRQILGGEVAEAFFAAEEADARRLLAVRRIADDATLAPEERASRVEAIYAEVEADLPPEVRAARATARLATTLRTAEAEIRARGGDAAEMQAMRARLAGPEAAARLGELDRRRAEWQRRVDDYRSARGRIEGETTRPPDERAAAVDRLLRDSFTATERRRVEALDRMAADTPAH